MIRIERIKIYEKEVKMCDRIIMPDGSEVESIQGEDECLCGNTQRQILIWIVEHLPNLEFDETVSINRDPFGYFVTIKKETYNEMLSPYDEQQLNFQRNDPNEV